MDTSARTASADKLGLDVKPAHRASYPVSVKGVVVQRGRVLLLHNERGEWELPGGRLEPHETPERCVAREIKEETGWQVRTGSILDSWLYHIEIADRLVFIVTYGCLLTDGQDDLSPVLSHEHERVGLFERRAISDLMMPAGYKRSVETWYGVLQSGGTPLSGTGTADCP